MNPIIPTVFAADPSVHIWPDDERIWIYASHDEPDTNTHDSMSSYHVFSSVDLVNWIDYGVALHLNDVKWAISHMWAIDAVVWKGTYYLVYCAIEKESGLFQTGLAKSDLPQGPFTDIGFIKGIHNGQDPALFIDEDQTPYLYWGYGGECFGCKLSEDLLNAVEGTTVELTEQLEWIYEGPWVHKYQDKYYLSYPGLYEGNWPEIMYYAMADHPLGPYTFMGSYIDKFEGQSGTNHGSIAQFKGNWLAFYHSAWQSKNGTCRSLMCDYLEYNDDGTIKPITPSLEGVSLDPIIKELTVTILIGAEQGEHASGELRGTYLSQERHGYTGLGYITGFDGQNYSLTVTAQCCMDMAYQLYMRYASDEDQKNKVMVNHILIDDPKITEERYDKIIDFSKTEGWKEIFVGNILLKKGDNRIRCYAGTGGIDVDYFRLVRIQ